MILLRSVVYFVAMVLSVMVFGLIVAIGGRFRPVSFSDRWASRWGQVNLWLQRVICDLDYRVDGAENLPDGPCIIMSKHQSTWETISLRGFLRDQQSWVLKQELLQLPLFGSALKLVRSIPIDRSAGRRAIIKVVQEGRRRLDEGRYVIVFPEGTRTAPGDRRKYGIGGGILAEKTGCPVIPVAHNAGVYWRRRGVKKYPGTIQVVIGKPLPTEGRKAGDIMRDVENWIESRQEKLPITVPNSK